VANLRRIANLGPDLSALNVASDFGLSKPFDNGIEVRLRTANCSKRMVWRVG